MSSCFCTPEQTMQRLKNHEMLAFIDVREQEEFCRSHVLRASCIPLSRLELLILSLVPSLSVPIIVMDNGEEDTRAQRAYQCLVTMGYTNVQCLDDGLAGWIRAGLVTVNGTSCMTKAYAECLERDMKTPGLTPEEVDQYIARGGQVIHMDIREPHEYASMAIPSSVCVPGCEAAYRLLDLVPSPDTLILTNCGSRTRGILCAQMLLDLGIPNPVASLKGGTLNWKLTGHELEFGRRDCTAAPSRQAVAFACERAAVMAQKYGISFVDAQTLQDWKAQAAEHPLYICDVRQPQEYEAGHLSGSRCTPGCQLVQRSDDYAAVRAARFVLVDDTEARAVITAYWLKQLGIVDVHVLKGGIGGSGLGRHLETGPEIQPIMPCTFSRSISANELAHRLESDLPPLVINVGSSAQHRQGHIPGAVWVSRSRMELVHREFPTAAGIVLTADDEIHARFAAADATSLWPEAEVSFMEGGNQAWFDHGLQAVQGMPHACCAEDDIWYLVYKDPHASPEAMEEFFDWNLTLAQDVARDGSCAFRLPCDLTVNKH